MFSASTKSLLSASRSLPKSLHSHKFLTSRTNGINIATPQLRRHYFIYPGPKSLDSIIDVRKFSELNAPEQKYIWNKGFEKKLDAYGDTLTGQQYHVMSRRVAANRHFILPVDKGHGYINMYCQQQDDYCLMTNLREFKERGPAANPYVVVQHFPDLMAKSDVVLVRAEIDTRWIDKPEAGTLVRILHKFYLMDNLYEQFVEPFNKRPHEFNYNKFLEACRATKLVVRDTERDYEQGIKERPKDPLIEIDLDKLFRKW